MQQWSARLDSHIKTCPRWFSGVGAWDSPALHTDFLKTAEADTADGPQAIVLRPWHTPAGKRLIEHSLAVKFVLLTVAGQLVLFAALTLHNGKLLEESLEQPFRLRVDNLKPLLNALLAPLLVEKNYAALDERLQETRSDEDIRYLVLRNADDVVVASAGWDRSTPLPLASKRVLDSDEVFDTFLLIEAGGRKYGTLNLGLSTQKLASYRDDLLWRGFVILAFGMLVLGFIQALLALHLTRRLRRVSAASEEIALGNFDLELDASGRDEVARLAASMNAMSAAIREKVRSLEQSEEHLRLAMDVGAVVPWQRNLADDSLNWGEGVERLLGPLPAGQTNYPDLLAMTFPDSVTDLVHARNNAIRSASVYRCDIRICRTDGNEAWLAVHGKFKRDSGAAAGYLIGVTRDITADKRAELEILRLNEVLENRVAERTAELRDAIQELEAFSHTISHDLRAPLRAMSGYLDLIRTEFPADAMPGNSSSYLARIQVNASRMSQMLDDLLLFSQASRSPIQRRDVDPAAVVAALLDELSPPEAARASVGVKAMPVCQADPGLLRQVYANLISNALKYSAKVAQPRVDIGAMSEGANETVYFVRDNGAGFDMAQAAKLFGVFQRLHGDRDFEGSGVGLSIVYRIVTRHGGRVWAEAAPGEGATFYFTIPATGPDRTAGPAREPLLPGG